MTGITDTVIVLAGGDIPESELLFINEYNVNGTGWISGPKMPTKVFGARMITFKVTYI